jgi:hypothetical protein
MSGIAQLECSASGEWRERTEHFDEHTPTVAYLKSDLMEHRLHPAQSGTWFSGPSMFRRPWYLLARSLDRFQSRMARRPSGVLATRSVNPTIDVV